MASAKPEVVFDLFMKYASKQGQAGAVWLVRPVGLRRLLGDMCILDGVPMELVDAYVRQIFIRADMDRDGALSLEEFVLWLAAEAFALLPFTSWSCLRSGHHGLVPLYNRFARVCSYTELLRREDSRQPQPQQQQQPQQHQRQQHQQQPQQQLQQQPPQHQQPQAQQPPQRQRQQRQQQQQPQQLQPQRQPEWEAPGSPRGAGWEEGSKRRQAPGVTVRQLLDMLLASKVISSSRREDGEVRCAAKLALQGARADRVLGQLEGANHLSWVLFVRALTIIAAKGMGVAQLLLRIMAAGTAPPLQLPPAPAGDGRSVESLFMMSDVEGELVGVDEQELPVRGSGDLGGATYRLWLLAKPAAMRAQVEKANQVLLQRLRGYVLPATFPPLQHASRICTRNVRAAFHRYCARWNKGPMPPANMLSSPPRPASQQGPESPSRRGPAGRGPGAGGPRAAQPHPGPYGAPEPLDAPWSWYWGSCCCCFRSLSTLELAGWMRICGESATVGAAVLCPGSNLTPHRLHHVFVYSASIAGSYLADDSSGVHDLPVPHGRERDKMRLELPRGEAAPITTARSRYGATVKSLESLRRSLSDSQRGSMQQAAGWVPLPRDAEREGGGSWAEEAEEVEDTLWSPTGRGRAPWSPSAGSSPKQQAHRAPVLSLTFVQFLEALRLLAEQVVGHPARNDAVEAVLLSLVHDICCFPYPSPDTTNCRGLSGWGLSPRPGSAGLR